MKERDVRNVIAEVEAIIRWRLRECIRVRELAATHRLGRMRRLRRLEEQKACETGTEMDAQRFRTSLDSEHFHAKLYRPRWPHVPEKHTPEMRVDVERLRMEVVLSQPATPPQYDSSPRRLLVIGTGPYEPGVSRAESQSTEREGTFPLQASVDGVLHVSYTRPEQECILHQVDVGANVQKTMNSEKVVACEKLRDHRRSGSSKEGHHGLPSKASNWEIIKNRSSRCFYGQKRVYLKTIAA